MEDPWRQVPFCLLDNGPQCRTSAGTIGGFYETLGIKLFSLKVRAPSSHLRAIIEERPLARSYIAPESPEKTAEEAVTIEAEKSFYRLKDSVESNPYLWNLISAI